MSLINVFVEELERESHTTRKMLERVPIEKFDWQPHPKSMKLGHLATHIAELPSWIGMALNTPELNFAANPYAVPPIHSITELLDYYENNLADGKAELSKAKEEQLSQPWTMRNGADIYSTETKGVVIRMALSQTIHHRAQLGVYLRLLNIPIPGSYGPSADELNF